MLESLVTGLRTSRNLGITMKFKQVFLATVASLLLAGAADAKTLRLSTLTPQESIWGKNLQRMIDEIEAADVGLEIEVFWNGQLGSMGETFKQMVMGRTDIWVGTIPYMSSVTPELSLLHSPFLWENDEIAKCAVPLVEDTVREMTQSKYHLLDLGPLVTTDFSARVPVRVPSDIAGMRVRVAPTPGNMAYYKAAGAVPQDISPSEAPGALQTGLIDATDTDGTYYVLTGTHKILPYHTVLGATHTLGGYVVSPRTWAQLNDAQKAAMQTAADKMDFAETFDAFEEYDAQLLKKAESEGTTLVQLTPAERDQWVEIARRNREQIFKDNRGDTAPLIAAIEAAWAACGQP